MMNFGEMNYTL
ncbi:Protein of unknown function [Bacillus mycoides]|nr:Protein of unknown function [Bacillus mycoides]